MNNYPNNYGNQVYGTYGMNAINPMQPQAQRMQPMEQQYAQYSQPQPIYKQPVGLQGKSVDSVDVVKAMDIPLDGSVSYFPLTDGTAIVTKQLQMDGSSKTVIYKPVEEKEPEQTIEYITSEQLDEAIKKVDNRELKDDIKSMKRQIKDLIEDMKDINENLNNRKD